MEQMKIWISPEKKSIWSRLSQDEDITRPVHITKPVEVTKPVVTPIKPVVIEQPKPVEPIKQVIKPAEKNGDVHLTKMLWDYDNKTVICFIIFMIIFAIFSNGG
jgi:hypothetical protein